MNKNLLISVIIPVYNEEKYLGFCLESLKKQTYKNLEIIVVDDGSTDKSRDTANKYGVRLFEQSHSGPGNARNLGASKANGEILAFLDADMKYDKYYIERLIQPIIAEKTIGTFNKNEYVANSGNIWARCWAINSDLTPDRHSPADIPDEVNIFRAVLKEEFKKAGGFNPNKGYFDDTTISDKLNKKALGVDDAISYHYNPETFAEIFYSARWIGRGLKGNKLKVFLRYSIFNSLRISILKSLSVNAPLEFTIFKITYDFGILCGIFLSFGKKEK